MDEIINSLLNETSTKDSKTYSVPEESPYLKDRMAELDEEYSQMQRKLLKTALQLTHKKDCDLATTNC